MNILKRILPHHKFFIVAIIISIVAVLGTFNYLINYSGFAAGVAKSIIGIGLFYLTDHYLLHEIDTLTEIKKGNIAYAILILSYAIIYSICIAAS